MTSQIISQEGYDKLKEELDHLKNVKRKEIAQRIQTAKDMGDLSENAEYAEAKEAQAFNEGRIAEIKQLLKNLTVVENKITKDEVMMGSVVKALCNEKEKEFTIVSFNEADPTSGKISNESPLGRALLNRKAGDELTVETPRGEMKCKILNIK